MSEKPVVPDDAVAWLREQIDPQLVRDINTLIEIFPRARRDARAGFAYAAACRVLTSWKTWESDPYNAAHRRAVREAAEALRALLAKAGL